MTDGKKRIYRFRCNLCDRVQFFVSDAPPKRCTYSTCKDRKKQDLTIVATSNIGARFKITEADESKDETL